MGSGNAAFLHDVNTSPDADVVLELRNALDLAERGELRSLVLVGTLIGGATFTSYATTDAIRAIGQIELLKHKLVGAMPDVDDT